MAWIATWWPRLVGVAIVATVGAPAAVASYLHARTVVARTDPAMAAWLPLTTDGLLLGALVVMWARRLVADPVGRGPWAAFALGMAATIAANLAAAPASPEGFIVALWPPVALAVTLELVAILVGHSSPGERLAHDAGEELTELASAGGELVKVEDTDSRAQRLLDAGAGRPRLVRELGITDHQARQLLRARVHQQVVAQ